MRLGRTVWFEAEGSIRIGQVVGIRGGGKAVGNVLDGTEDGLNVQINTVGETLSAARAQVHRLSEASRIGSATAELLQVPLGVNVDGEPVAGTQESDGHTT